MLLDATNIRLDLLVITITMVKVLIVTHNSVMMTRVADGVKDSKGRLRRGMKEKILNIPLWLMES